MTGTSASARLFPRYTPSWLGLLRIIFWCALSLWAFGSPLPKPLPEHVPFERALAGTGVVPQSLRSGDDRSFREDAAHNGHKINIAWISDSGEALAPKGKLIDEVTEDQFHFLPSLVSQKLRKHPGFANVGIDLYAQLGLHPANLLLNTLQAIDNKPDLIVIELNPVWAFSPYQFHNMRDSLYAAPGLFSSHPALWPYLPLFVSPSQDVLALIGDRFPVLREATPVRGYIDVHLASAPVEDEPFVLKEPRIPVNYWLLKQVMEQRPRSPAMTSFGKNLTIEDFFLALVYSGSTQPRDTFSLGAVEDMLRALKDSDIPTLIYTAPLDDRFYADPAVAAQLEQIKAYLSTAAPAIAGSKVTIIPAVPEKVRKSIKFVEGDGFHKWDAGTLDSYLAAQVEKMVGTSNSAKQVPKK